MADQAVLLFDSWLAHVEARAGFRINKGDLMADEKKPEPVHGEPMTIKHPKVDKPIVQPDGHVVLSQEDLDARA